MSSRRHKKRKLKAEINVVPYIDVMLVLLIIFMVTAPLLNLGVDIDLPQSTAKSIQSKEDPVIVSVDRGGRLFLTLQGDANREVTRDEMVAKVKAFVSQRPNVPVYVAGDANAPYQTVYDVLSTLQTDAGVARAGLMSTPTK
ncbi:Cell division and transport-associated protein TolR [Solilutibacter tolerans]|uniref:Tol-Pal system protein TolR n=2 Tax=Solilutibacter tolerans TaxID=1604334 RepID=A0A1N6NHD2_9GAMM|nr:Cell division and transport-associated protein TolR [Lysobacter tolerans]